VVIWIDNQYAAFTPGGRIAFGVLEGKEEWIEVKDIVITDVTASDGRVAPNAL
jgi:hypothetical protein